MLCHPSPETLSSILIMILTYVGQLIGSKRSRESNTPREKDVFAGKP